MKKTFFLLILFLISFININAQNEDLVQAYFNSIVITPDYLFDSNFKPEVNDSIAERKAEDFNNSEESKRQEPVNCSSGRAGRGFGGNNNRNFNNVSTQGVGGIRTSAKVGSRKVLSLPSPQYTDKASQGTVVVTVVINKAGTVTSASVASGNTSQALKDSALMAAKKSKFSAGDNNAEKGTITYNFRIK